MRQKDVLFPVVVIICAAALGIGSRHTGMALPQLVTDNAGDVLWALALFAFVRLLLPRIALGWILLLTLDISLLVEISQLWHPPFLDAIRSVAPVALILGNSFRFYDLLCYLIGGLMGYAIFMVKSRLSS